jgi:UDP-N-acetylglucosamine--N-acetylmuramyl-(pentapeptide) pyrophosphoryl-undecaprenol N-acetylglucosamine transferase
MKKQRKILLAAGGTGGHLFPAIAIAEELAKRKISAHLITDQRCAKYLTPDLPVEAHIINIHMKMSGLIAKIKSLAALILACFHAIILLHKIRPNLVIGFGGYPSFPSLLAAILLGIPIVIHEQNCFFGKSNRIFARFAKLIALSYKETKNINPKFKSKIIFTGDIVRSKIYNLPPKKSFSGKNFHLFIVGGSQGAQIFSKLVPNAIKKLKKLNPKLNISITQQTSKADQASVSQIYAKLGIKHELAEFFHNMPEIYKKSQLVIARSGASTIGELTSIGLPAIFVPFPYAAEDHQYFNAKALADNGASWCYRQEEISDSILSEKIHELTTNKKLLEQASIALIARKNNGAEYLVDTVLKINR